MTCGNNLQDSDGSAVKTTNKTAFSKAILAHSLLQWIEFASRGNESVDMWAVLAILLPKALEFNLKALEKASKWTLSCDCFIKMLLSWANELAFPHNLGKLICWSRLVDKGSAKVLQVDFEGVVFCQAEVVLPPFLTLCSFKNHHPSEV